MYLITKNIILVILFFSIKVSYSQKVCGCCYDSVKLRRVDVVGGSLLQEPFTSIVHLFTNSIHFRGTASFISDNILITAKHNLFSSKHPKNLFIFVNTKKGDTLIKIKRNQYSIIPLGSATEKGLKDHIENDIVLIVLNKKNNIINTKFSIKEFNSFKNNLVDTFHLTGYACDKEFDSYSTKFLKDTLTDKYVIGWDSLTFNSDSTIVGLNVCACSGDSGAPLWVKRGDIFYLLGIYHGLSNVIDPTKYMRVVALLDCKKILKIKQILRADPNRSGAGL